MSLELRTYQKNGVDAIRSEFLKGIKRLILCAPTGAGKTVMFSFIALNAIKKGNTVMIVCDRKELIGQAKEKLNSLGLYPTIIAPGNKQYKNCLYLASVDTLIRRELPEIDILIIDEAHKQRFDKIVTAYSEKFVIGATATPLRTGSQNSLEMFYQKIINPIKISELIQQQWLVEPTYFAPDVAIGDVKVKGNDYDETALFNAYNKQHLYDGVIDQFLLRASDRKAICFNVNVEHSKLMTARFIAAGIKSKHIDGNTPDAERKQILKEFKNGEFQVLNNCAVLTTGFDEPSIDCVIVNRKTMSTVLWHQMIGRGGRTHQDKEDFIVIDMGMNVYKHGLWEYDHEWTLKKPKKSKKAGVAPSKACPKCEAVLHTTVMICKYCDHIFEKKEETLKKGAFVKVDKKAIRGAKPIAGIKNYHQIAKEKGYKPGWAYFQAKLNKRGASKI